MVNSISEQMPDKGIRFRTIRTVFEILNNFDANFLSHNAKSFDEQFAASGRLSNCLHCKLCRRAEWSSNPLPANVDFKGSLQGFTSKVPFKALSEGFALLWIASETRAK